MTKPQNSKKQLPASIHPSKNTSRNNHQPMQRARCNFAQNFILCCGGGCLKLFPLFPLRSTPAGASVSVWFTLGPRQNASEGWKSLINCINMSQWVVFSVFHFLPWTDPLFLDGFEQPFLYTVLIITGFCLRLHFIKNLTSFCGVVCVLRAERCTRKTKTHTWLCGSKKICSLPGSIGWESSAPSVVGSSFLKSRFPTLS